MRLRDFLLGCAVIRVALCLLDALTLSIGTQLEWLAEPFSKEVLHVQYVLAIGHSHLKALEKAYHARKGRNGTEELNLRFVQLRQDLFKPPIAGEKLHPAILAAIQERPWAAVICMIGGNLHNVLGLLNHPTKFDFVLAEAPDLPLQPDADVLPYGLVRRQFAARLAPQLKIMSEIRAATASPVFHMESPPPIPSETHIRTYPGIFKDRIDAQGVAPAALRHKLWRINSDLYREICAAEGIEFIPAPAEMMDERGMLVEKAWNADPTHGNEIYGECLVRQILIVCDPLRAMESPLL